MTRVVPCLYQTTDTPQNPESYKKLQILAQVKINTVFNRSEALDKAIDILEKYFAEGISYDINDLKELSETASSHEEKCEFKKLLSIA